MDELDEAVDRLFTEVDHFERIIDTDDLDQDRIELALAVAKRVRRASIVTIRTFAALRDKNATALEAQAHEHRNT